MLNLMLKSVIDQDKAAVVICDLEHTVVYMNPAAIKRYRKWGGENLIGNNLLNCHNEKSRQMIAKTIAWFEKSVENDRVFTTHIERENMDVYMVALRGENGRLIGYYEKHEYRSPETAKPYGFEE